MDSNLVITIERQAGSGGHLIGKYIAGKLGIKCYDEELLSLAAKESGLAEQLFHTHDEQPTSSFLYSLVMDSYSMGYNSGGFFDMPINNKIFLAQFDTIKNLADKESCVIVGRCADYALDEYPGKVSTFIYADDALRIETICKMRNVSGEEAREMMINKDKSRSSYYNYYSNKKWGDAKCYDICINSGVLGIEKTGDFIIDFANAKFNLG